MGKTIQDEVREMFHEKFDFVRCEKCVYRGTDCSGVDCEEAAADTLLAALDARGLEIVRKGKK